MLDKTSTAMGKRMLRSWVEQPLITPAAINQRLDAVQALVEQTMTRGELAEQLHYVFDIERLMTRTVYGSATPKEIYALAQTCDRLPQLLYPGGKLQLPGAGAAGGADRPAGRYPG